LSENKIKKLNSTYRDNATRVRYLLGLDIIRTYRYNVSLQYLNSTTADPKYIYIPNNTHPALCIGSQIPETAEVEKMERLVTIEGDSEVGYLNIDATNTSNATLRLPKLDSFTVKLEGFAEKNRTADARLEVRLNNTNTNYSCAPVINKSGTLIGGWHSFNKTVIDDLCESNEVRIDTSWCNVSYMWVNRSNWGDCVGDMSMPSAKLVVYIMVISAASDNRAQLHTLEGFAAAMLMVGTVYLVVSAVTLSVPQTELHVDAQLKAYGQDALNRLVAN